MDRDTLGSIDDYIQGLFVGVDPALEATVEESKRAGLPEIQVSPNQGRLLQILARLVGARRILEIGTLGGFSAIHFARALTDGGLVISLELSEEHAEVASDNLERAGLRDRVEIRVGDAREILREMISDSEEPFDVVFIDADKEGYPDYLDLSLALSRPGTLILADNTIRNGSILEPNDLSSTVMREFNEKFARHERLTGIILPLLREGIDGISIARVES